MKNGIENELHWKVNGARLPKMIEVTWKEEKTTSKNVKPLKKMAHDSPCHTLLSY